MPRSVWKGPFVDAFLMKMKWKGGIPHECKIWSRRSTILPEFLNNVVRIHNGRDFITCKITEDMIGRKFGEFAPTRKLNPHEGHIKKALAAKAKPPKNSKTGKR